MTIFLLIALGLAQAPHPAMPPGMTHDDHQKQMAKDEALKKRGAAAMGFDQDRATHHFRLTADGGRIEVAVKDPTDAASLAAIRAHLREIADDFARGDFDKPFATHGEMPPGVATMQERKRAISFAYEDAADGGRVTIRTSDAAARDAVHEFLRYQIREHHTGDPERIAGRR